MCRAHVPEGMAARHDFRHGSAAPAARRLRPDMNNRRLTSIGFAACICLTVTLTAMTMVAHSADAQWHSLFGLLAGRVAAMFTPPPSWNSAGSDRAILAGQLYMVGYATAGALFAALFWLRSNSPERRSPPANAALLALQLLIAVTVETDLLYLFAAELAIVLPLRRALAWLAAMIAGHFAQTFAIIVAVARSDQGARYGLLSNALDTVYYLLAFGVATLAMLEQRARLKLAASHAELQATQALLADTVRTSERLRIARELHDSIGHHLTALNLHLDLADRQLAGANASLRIARGLSRELLGEVRVVVGAQRDDQFIDLKQSLQTLCDGIPAPSIRLEMADDARISSALTAHTLFRCVQEAISNVLRHADARHISIAIAHRDARVTATIRDDGRGARGRPEGNGLVGMRERLLAVGGALSTGDLPQGGFQVELSLPVAEPSR